MPNTVGRFLKGGTAGIYNPESLPNITGHITPEYFWAWTNATGSLYTSTEGKGVAGTPDYNRVTSLDFDASKSSSTYKDGAKVQPDNIEVTYCIKY